MAAATRFKLDKRGIKRFQAALSASGFDSAVKKHILRASIKNGKMAEAAARQVIRRGGFEPNRPLTVMIKGSSKPLVDQGTGLFQAITSKVVEDFTVFVGVLRSSGAYNIAATLHDGAVIKVTDAMRGMFFALWKASTGEMDPSQLEGRAAELWERAPGGWLPLKKSTSHITIPARPFMLEVFRDAALRKKAKRNWNMALKKAMRELANKG